MTTTDAKSTAAQFLADHEQLENDLASAKLTLDDQRKEIERLDATLSMQKDAIAAANIAKDTYLQYAFELSAQLQFIVAGSARALMIAGNVRNAIAVQASNIPPVAGADVAELEGILERIGQNNAAAGDGNGLSAGYGQPGTAGVLVGPDGLPVRLSAATKSMQQPLVA